MPTRRERATSMERTCWLCSLLTVTSRNQPGRTRSARPRASFSSLFSRDRSPAAERRSKHLVAGGQRQLDALGRRTGSLAAMPARSGAADRDPSAAGPPTRPNLQNARCAASHRSGGQAQTRIHVVELPRPHAHNRPCDGAAGRPRTGRRRKPHSETPQATVRKSNPNEVRQAVISSSPHRFGFCGRSGCHGRGSKLSRSGRYTSMSA